MALLDEKIKQFLKKTFLIKNFLVLHSATNLFKSVPIFVLVFTDEISEGCLKSLRRKSGHRFFLSWQTAQALENAFARDLQDLPRAFV